MIFAAHCTFYIDLSSQRSTVQANLLNSVYESYARTRLMQMITWWSHFYTQPSWTNQLHNPITYHQSISLPIHVCMCVLVPYHYSNTYCSQNIFLLKSRIYKHYFTFGISLGWLRSIYSVNPHTPKLDLIQPEKAKCNFPYKVQPKNSKIDTE